MNILFKNHILVIRCIIIISSITKLHITYLGDFYKEVDDVTLTLDQVSGPDDDDINIFENAGEVEPPDEEETCFPIKIKATQNLVVICL